MNALVFHIVTAKTSVKWDRTARPPAVVRVAGFTSIVLWAAVIIAGRIMSYTMFSYP